jgi:hypothetical protein
VLPIADISWSNAYSLLTCTTPWKQRWHISVTRMFDDLCIPASSLGVFFFGVPLKCIFTCNNLCKNCGSKLLIYKVSVV